MNPNIVTRIIELVALLVAVIPLSAIAGTPVVTNVHGEQRPNTDLVDVYYDLDVADSASVLVRLEVSADGGLNWSVPVVNVSQSVGACVSPGKGKHILWNAGADWNGQVSKNVRFRVTASDASSLQSGLVAYYPFDGDILDASGHGNHAIANGTINFESGIAGQAASFYQSWLQIPNVLNDLQSFSISLWAYERGMVNAGPGDAESGGEAYIWFGDHGGDLTGIASWGGDWAQVGYTNVALEAGLNPQGTYPARIDQVRPKSEWRNCWHHCAMTYNSQQGTRSFFIDGLLVNQKGASKTPFLGFGAIASHTWVDTLGRYRSYRLVGLIDEVRIYDRALSSTEIQQLYEVGSSVSP